MQRPEAVLTGAIVGQLGIAGFSVSFTITRKVQVLVKPAASVARTVTVVTPLLKLLPLPLPAVRDFVVAPLKECCREGLAVQLSEAVAVYPTVAVQVPLDVNTLWLAGQLRLGACVSFTVMVKVQVRVLFAASVAIHVTVVAPTGNVLPLRPPFI